MNKNSRKVRHRKPGPAPTRRDRRSSRYSTREELYTVSSLPRVRDCGRPIGLGGVTVRLSGTVGSPDAIAGYSGLATCGSVWACPVCSAKVANERQSDIETVVNEHMARGGDVAMLTLTMRHRKGQPLAKLWKEGVAAGWKAATNGAGWKRDKEEHGVNHYVRVVEVTHGDNGWHVHVHALLLGENFQDSAKLKQLGQRMFARWSVKLQRQGFAAPIEDKGGLKIQRIAPGKEAANALADYFTKAGMDPDVEWSDRYADARAEAKNAREMAHKVSMEAARSDLKEAKHGNRTPWGILSDFLKTGDMADLDLWHEYEAGSKGKRQVVWSRGCREEYGLGQERTDEEVAEEEFDGEDVALIDAREYRTGCRRSAQFPAQILDAAEDHGRAGIDAVLQQYGLRPSMDVPQPPDSP